MAGFRTVYKRYATASRLVTKNASDGAGRYMICSVFSRLLLQVDAIMNKPWSHKLRKADRRRLQPHEPSRDARWERLILCLLWALAAACLVLAIVIWRQLLNGSP